MPKFYHGRWYTRFVQEKNSFLIRLLCVVIILAIFLFLFVRDASKQSPATIKVDSSMCPASGWVDCMPSVDTEKKISCSTQFLKWAKANCPNFQGAAY